MDLKKECLQRKIKQEIENECYNSADVFVNPSNVVKIKFEDTNNVYEDVESELHALINSTQPGESHQLKECKSTTFTKNIEGLPDRQICRLCAQAIRGNEVFLYENSDLQQKINFTLPITTGLGDGLPEYICRNCEMNLNLFYEFVCKVVSADKTIRGKVTQADFKNSDVTNATIKQIFGADISELEETNKDSVNKKCLEQEIIESKHSGDIKATIPKDKSPSKQISLDDEDRSRKVPKLSEDASAQQQPPKLQYKCHKCCKYFDDYQKVVNHNKKVHSMVEYPCPDCLKTFTSDKALCQHIKDNHNAPVVCHICGKIFIRKEFLEKHHDKVHNVKVCHTCEMSFKSKVHYESHKLLHKNVEEYQCVFCYVHFNSRHQLLRHTRQVHSGKYTVLVDKKGDDF